MNELISIIVPAYNAGSYIDHIFTCLLRQTYSNLEIIIVNDGSTDDTLDKCQQYENQDSRIRVISQNNAGVAAARNRGLEAAQGEYIAFVDVDDYLEADYIETLYNAAVLEECDVVCCGCLQTEGNYSLSPMGEYPTVRENRTIRDYTTVLRDYCINDEQYGCVVWAKLIKRTLACSERFENLKYGEDKQYMLKILQHASKIQLLAYQGYYYIRWDASATVKISQTDISRLLDGISVAHTFREKCNATNQYDLIEMGQKIYVNAVISAIHASTRKDMTQYRAAREILKPKGWESLYINKIGIRKKMDILGYLFCGSVYKVAIGKLLTGRESARWNLIQKIKR